MTRSAARLLEGDGSTADRVHPLKLGVYVLGREPGVDILLDHGDVSRRHAELHVFQDGAQIVDLDSKNGLRVDGQPCQRARIGNGARVELGDLCLTLEHPGAQVEALLRREGEATARRPLLPLSVHTPAAEAPAVRPRSPLAPFLFAAAFALLAALLLVTR